MPVLLWGSNPSGQDEQSCEYFNITPCDDHDKVEDYDNHDDNINDDDIHDGDDNVIEYCSIMIFLLALLYSL